MKLTFTIIILIAIPVILGMILLVASGSLLVQRLFSSKKSEPVPLYPHLTSWESDDFIMAG